MSLSSSVRLLIGLFLLTTFSVSNGGSSWIDWGNKHSSEEHDDDSHEKQYCGSGLSCPSRYYGDDYTECCMNGRKLACCKPEAPAVDLGKMQPWAIALLILAMLFILCAIVMLLCACCSCCYWAGKRRRREYVVIRDQPTYSYSHYHGGYRG
ncbi:uncharacterized protein LOC135488011 [Lineus longissimus]|uniref:uncharacterized protein LOC135488011 n=1 Tax=Lineus longissimus TaxID=88925 RepID=UPI002B4CA9C0